MKKILLVLIVVFAYFNGQSQNVFGFEYERKSYDQVIVNNVLKNSPADKCGIQIGDYLVSINDDYFGNKNADEIAQLFQNAPISNNTIQFYRKSIDKQFSCTINKVPVQSFEFTCISENCNNGVCTLQSVRGYTMVGNCKNGIINGEAKFFVNDKLVFVGNVVNNVRKGKGIEYNKENTFEGNFENGMREGKGKMIFQDNVYLLGTWKKGQLEGKAELYNTKNELWKKRVYENGKIIKEDELLTSIPKVNDKGKTLTKDQALLKEILADKAATSAWSWKTYYFNASEVRKSDVIVLKQKAPLSNSDYKKYGQHVYAKVSPKILEKVVEQCTYENWPTFYKNYKNLDELFRGPFPNLIVEKLFDFNIDKDNGEYKKGERYAIIYISDKTNSHAPKELLSDDGIGFFMCISDYIIQEGKDNYYSYKPFTLDNFEKPRGFKNWTTKKRVYIFDMEHAKDAYDPGLISDADVKKNLNINDNELQQLKELCDAKNRPDGLKTDSDIKYARRNGKLLDAVVYNLLGNEMNAILYMPSSENQHLPYDLRPKNNDGWYFCTSSNIDKIPPSADTRSRILATTDASMEAYRKEQAAREEQMKKDLSASYEASQNNKLNGVVIYQFSNWSYQQRKEEITYAVVTILGPQDQEFLEIDKENVDKIVGGKPLVSLYKKGMNSSQAKSFIFSEIGANNFSINTNYSYSIPKRYTNNTNSNKELDKDIEAKRKDVDKLWNEMTEEKTTEKVEMRKKIAQEIFKTNGKIINEPEKVQILDISTDDKYYNENKRFIGKIGIVEGTLIEDSDATYHGTIKFDGEKSSTIFYKVKIKTIE